MQTGPVCRQILFIPLEQRPAHGDFGHVAVLDVHQLEVADDKLNFAMLRELKAEGASGFLGLPITSAHGTYNYMISYATDRPGGFTDADVAGLTQISRLLPLVIDMHSHRNIARNLLTF